MRIGIAPLSGLLILAGCWADQPSNQPVISTRDGPPYGVVAAIEAQLSSDTCLSQVATMRREYRFARRNGNVVRSLIDVQITKAGHDNLPAGIYILPPEGAFGIDDRRYFLALATYAVKEKALDLWACGMNASGSIRHDPRF